MFRKIIAMALAATLLLGGRALPTTQQTPPPDRIEEDWQVIVASPSPSESGPQITTTMSPEGDNARHFVAFNLNYRDTPFRAGGLEVRAWSGKTLLRASASITHTQQLATDNETITWTQRISLRSGTIFYSIQNGHSTTWGSFGGTSPDYELTGHLAAYFTCNLSDLSAYNPDYSSGQSDVGWQAQRVSQMRLLRVRYYADNVLIRTDSTPRDSIPSSS